MCFHKYSKWSEPYVAQVTKGFGEFGDKHLVHMMFQEKTCAKCGHVVARKVRDGDEPVTENSKRSFY